MNEWYEFMIQNWNWNIKFDMEKPIWKINIYTIMIHAHQLNSKVQWSKLQSSNHLNSEQEFHLIKLNSEQEFHLLNYSHASSHPDRSEHQRMWNGRSAWQEFAKHHCLWPKLWSIPIVLIIDDQQDVIVWVVNLPMIHHTRIRTP